MNSALIPLSEPQSSFDSFFVDDSITRLRRDSDIFFNPKTDDQYTENLHSNSQYEAALGQFGGFDLDRPYPGARAAPTVLGSSAPPVLQGWSAQLEKEFQSLWHYVWKVKAFVDYRAGQPSKARATKKKDDIDWSPLREEMFFRALVKHRPVGRQQVRYPSAKMAKMRNKRNGRNELVADSINRWLDLNYEKEYDYELPPEERAVIRKHISSHLQVLKPKFKTEPWIIRKYLYNVDKKDGRRTSAVDSSRGGLRSAHLDERKDASQHALVAHAGSSLVPDVPMLPSQSTYESPCTLEPADFSMYLRSGCPLQAAGGHVCEQSNDCRYKTLHVFTKSQPDVWEPDAKLENDPMLASAFPELAHGQECPVLCANASLALPNEPITSENVELSIDSTFSTDTPLDQNFRWRVQTKFFEDGNLVEWPNKDGALVSFAWQSLRSDQLQHRGKYRHIVPFGSEYWAQRIGRLVSLRQRAFALSNSTDPRTGKHETTKQASEQVERIKKDIKSTKAVQEVFAYDRRATSNEQPRRCLIIYWRFRQTDYPGEIGTTVFRNISVISAKQEPQSFDNDNVPDVYARLVEQPDTENDVWQGLHHPVPHSLNALASVATLDSSLSNSLDWSDIRDFTVDNGTRLAFPDTSTNTMAGASTYNFAFPNSHLSTATASNFPLSAFDPALDFEVVDAADGASQSESQGPSQSQSPTRSSLPSPHDNCFGSDYFGAVDSQASTAASSYQEVPHYSAAAYDSQDIAVCSHQTESSSYEDEYVDLYDQRQQLRQAHDSLQQQLRQQQQQQQPGEEQERQHTAQPYDFPPTPANTQQVEDEDDATLHLDASWAEAMQQYADVGTHTQQYPLAQMYPPVQVEPQHYDAVAPEQPDFVTSLGYVHGQEEYSCHAQAAADCGDEDPALTAPGYDQNVFADMEAQMQQGVVGVVKWEEDM